MNRLMTFFGVIALAAAPAVLAQQTITLPPLTITGSSIDSAVSYDASRAVYRYTYTLRAPATNQAQINCFTVDVGGRTAHQQLDADLQGNVVRREPAVQFQPATAIPIGITVPDPAHTVSLVGKTSALSLCSLRGAWDVQPGSTQGGFVVESKFPPAFRSATLRPSTLRWQEITDAASDDDTFVPGDAGTYTITTSVIAPFEPLESDYYDGGGQQPAEVNKFLRYLQPKDNRLKVPATTTSYAVIVAYGTTIVPSTFAATLNGANVTAQFHPIPGSTEIVTIPIGPGTTKLHLSVDGTKSSGGKGTDSDTLTFLPQ